jgi:hypothetical protein
VKTKTAATTSHVPRNMLRCASNNAYPMLASHDHTGLRVPVLMSQVDTQTNVERQGQHFMMYSTSTSQLQFLAALGYLVTLKTEENKPKTPTPEPLLSLGTLISRQDSNRRISRPILASDSNIFPCPLWHLKSSLTCELTRRTLKGRHFLHDLSYLHVQSLCHLINEIPR